MPVCTSDVWMVVDVLILPSRCAAEVGFPVTAPTTLRLFGPCVKVYGTVASVVVVVAVRMFFCGVYDGAYRFPNSACSNFGRNRCAVDEGGVQENELGRDNDEAFFVDSTSKQGFSPDGAVATLFPRQYGSCTPLPNVFCPSFAMSTEWANSEVRWAGVEMWHVMVLSALDGEVPEVRGYHVVGKTGPCVVRHVRGDALRTPSHAIIVGFSIHGGGGAPNQLYSLRVAGVTPVLDPFRVGPPACPSGESVAQHAQDPCGIGGVLCTLERVPFTAVTGCPSSPAGPLTGPCGKVPAVYTVPGDDVYAVP